MSDQGLTLKLYFKRRAGLGADVVHGRSGMHFGQDEPPPGFTSNTHRSVMMRFTTPSQ